MILLGRNLLTLLLVLVVALVMLRLHSAAK